MANNLEMLLLCKNDYNNVINNKDNYSDLIIYGTIFLDSAEKLWINIKDRKYADNDFLEMLMSRYPKHMYSRLSLFQRAIKCSPFFFIFYSFLLKILPLTI